MCAQSFQWQFMGPCASACEQLFDRCRGDRIFVVPEQIVRSPHCESSHNMLKVSLVVQKQVNLLIF